MPRALALTSCCLVLLLGFSARAATPCTQTGSVRLWLSPAEPRTGQPLFVMATGIDQPLPAGAELFIEGKSVASETEDSNYRSGSLGKVTTAAVTVELRKGATVLACRHTKVSQKATPRPQPAVHWQTRQVWDSAYESLFAAWVHHLFAAAPDATLEFRPLAQALSDPTRNGLYNHLGLREDEAAFKGALKAAPDCADLPYVLRAYFAWKHELPFGFRECDRGTRDRPPRCPILHTNEEPSSAKDALAAFKGFLRILVNKVHSGSLRTALDDDETDFYPVPLSRQALQPGTIFADPYGHVLVLSGWVDRAEGQPGLLFAVDGQPDASVGRKRFWEGNFLYAHDVPSAGAGWKTFRPFARKSGSEGGSTWQPLTNAELARRPNQPFDAQLAKMNSETFYARMFGLINPRGLTATAAYDDVLQALVEQIEARVRSVDNGEQYMRQTNNRLIEMPQGGRIFETVGPWEDYATPSRDMRLLIAMTVLEGLPNRITQHPKLFALEGKTATQVRADLEARHLRLTKERRVAYKNSDGQEVTLTVADVLERRHALELAYNPNDCVEIRWGASEGSSERGTCRREAPAEQRQRMRDNRVWFATMRRPARE